MTDFMVEHQRASDRGIDYQSLTKPAAGSSLSATHRDLDGANGEIFIDFDPSAFVIGRRRGKRIC